MEQSPYEPPQAEIRDADSQYPYKRSVWWKAYFFFIVSLSAIDYYLVLTDPVAGLVEYFLFALWAIASIGLFGFTFCRPILGPKFWLVIIFADFAFSLLYHYVGGVANIDLRVDMTDSEYFISSVIGWAFTLPVYLGLFLYSRPTDRAWRDTEYFVSGNQD